MKTFHFHTEVYVLKWQIIGHEHYKVSECKKVINIRTGRMIKETVVGYTRGFWIGKKFFRSKSLNKYVEVIPGYKLPF